MDEKRKLLVYHGGTELIEHPLYNYGRSLLDFGKGFYVTDIKEQAIMWAKIIAIKRGLEPVVSRYLLDWDSIVRQAKCRLFGYYDEDWLNFVVLCRKGYDPSRKFDYIEGGVADDRVIYIVNSVISQGDSSVQSHRGNSLRTCRKAQDRASAGSPAVL